MQGPFIKKDEERHESVKKSIEGSPSIQVELQVPKIEEQATSADGTNFEKTDAFMNSHGNDTITP